MNSVFKQHRLVLILVGILIAIPLTFNSCDNLGKVTGESYFSSDGPMSNHAPPGEGNLPTPGSKPLIAQINVTMESDPITVSDYVRVGQPPVSYIIDSGKGTISQVGVFTPSDPGQVKVLVNDASLEV